MKICKFEGKDYKVFFVKAFGDTYGVIVTKKEYLQGGLALEALSVEDIGEENFEVGDSFGVITVNLPHSAFLDEDNQAFVKNWSENADWAEDLAKQIGGKATGITAPSGFVDVPLYDFSNLNIYAEETNS